ncbi:MAG: hypothetical protein ACXVBW_15995, partial [Bdellovibrionota bacterium]
MSKKPFLIFIAIISALVGGALWFIQSPGFAGVVKRIASRYIPQDMGIEGDFSEFAIKLFPPGISIKKPRIALGRHNLIHLPEGSAVSAERVDLNFLPLQMFSGNIRVNEVVIVNGDVSLVLDPALFNTKNPKAPKREFHWDELLQIKADAISAENTKFHLKTATEGTDLEFSAKSLRLGHWSGRGGPGYEGQLELSDIHGKLLKDFQIPDRVDAVKAVARVNPSGLQIDRLTFSSMGIQATLEGAIKGNLLAPKGLTYETTLVLDAKAEELVQFAGPLWRSKLPLSGEVNFQGKVRGPLERPSENFRAEGSLKAAHLRYGDWRAEEFKADGTFLAAPGGGEVTVSKITVSQPEREKHLGQQSGDGGRVEIGAFHYLIGGKEPVRATMVLSRAHIHWLAAGDLKDIYPMDMRISGPVEAVFTPPSKSVPWSLQAKLGLKVEKFALDNQHPGVVKPFRQVLKVPNTIEVDGNVAVDPEGLRPLGVTLTLPHSKFHVTGKVDFASS